MGEPTLDLDKQPVTAHFRGIVSLLILISLGRLAYLKYGPSPARTGMVVDILRENQNKENQKLELGLQRNLILSVLSSYTGI